MTWLPLNANANREGRRIGNPAVWKVRPHLQTNECYRNTEACSQWFNARTGNYTRCRCSEVKK